MTLEWNMENKIMTEKIYWDSLQKSIEVWVKTIQALPDDLYACPRCEGTGRIQVGHADPGPNPTIKCGMCNGSQMIKKCNICQENPVPSNDRACMCHECNEKYLNRVLEFEKRPEIVCNFPQLAVKCPTPDLRETNSNGNLVCDLELCDFAQRKYGVYPEECIVRMTNGDDYCINECVDREICPMNKAEKGDENVI